MLTRAGTWRVCEGQISFGLSVCCDGISRGRKTIRNLGYRTDSDQWKVQGGSPEGTLAWVRKKGCFGPTYRPLAVPVATTALQVVQGGNPRRHASKCIEGTGSPPVPSSNHLQRSADALAVPTCEQDTVGHGARPVVSASGELGSGAPALNLPLPAASRSRCCVAVQPAPPG